MRTWLEFEERFRKLAPQLQYSRIDDQTGAAGEYWRIAGGPTNRETEREFEILCDLAGLEITEALKAESKFNDVLNHTEPKVRWYRLLKKNSVNYTPGPTGNQTDDKGNNLVWIYSGTITRIGESSANLCLQLQATHPIKQRWFQTLYHDYGKQIIIGVILLLLGTIIGAWFK